MLNYGPSVGLMPQRYFGTAVGKGRQAAKTEIERLDLSSLTCRQGVTEVAKMCDPPFARSCECALPARCNLDYVLFCLEDASFMRPSLCCARCPTRLVCAPLG